MSISPLFKSKFKTWGTFPLSIADSLKIIVLPMCFYAFQHSSVLVLNMFFCRLESLMGFIWVGQDINCAFPPFTIQNIWLQLHYPTCSFIMWLISIKLSEVGSLILRSPALRNTLHMVCGYHICGHSCSIYIYILTNSYPSIDWLPKFGNIPRLRLTIPRHCSKSLWHNPILSELSTLPDAQVWESHKVTKLAHIYFDVFMSFE